MTHTGPVVSCELAGNPPTRTVKMSFPDPPGRVVFEDVPEAYWDLFLAARCGGNDVKVTYTTEPNTVTAASV